MGSRIASASIHQDGRVDGDGGAMLIAVLIPLTLAGSLLACDRPRPPRAAKA